MSQTRVRVSPNGFQKDKMVESEEDSLELPTNGTHAFYTLVVGLNLRI